MRFCPKTVALQLHTPKPMVHLHWTGMPIGFAKRTESANGGLRQSGSMGGGVPTWKLRGSVNIFSPYSQVGGDMADSLHLPHKQRGVPMFLQGTMIFCASFFILLSLC